MLVDSIGIVIEIPDATQQPRIWTLGEMAKRVARVMNAEDDPEILDTAMEGIRWAITYAEISKHFMFTRETTSEVTLATGVDTIDLPTDFFGVRLVELLYTATSAPEGYEASDVASTLSYLPYSQFRSHGTERNYKPLFWTAKNTFKDGVLYIGPTPTDDTDFTIRVTHDTPIELPDSPTDVIAAPKDFATIIIEGAKYFLLFERKGDDPTRFRHQFAVFENMQAKYLVHERQRHGRKHGAFKLGEPA